MAPISSLTERMVRRVGAFCDEVTDSSKEYFVQIQGSGCMYGYGLVQVEGCTSIRRR